MDFRFDDDKKNTLKQNTPSSPQQLLDYLYAHRKLRCHAQTQGQNCNHRLLLSHPKLR